MNIKIKMLVATVGSMVCAGAYAVPDLQLNITGGTYDTITETVIVTGGTLSTVNSYLQVSNKNSLTDQYAVSIALSPQTGPAPGNLGSFVFNGTTVNVTADMIYGTPPIDTLVTQLSDPGDLPTHGIFDTFFSESLFSFSSAQTTASVNTQDTPGYDPTGTPGTALHYQQFVVDTTNLAAGIALHFDLYNLKICDNSQGQCALAGDADIENFAPFSHDAEWRPGGFVPPPPPAPGVPEPAPLALLALGGMLIGWQVRRQRA